jgi:hypothetical protein
LHRPRDLERIGANDQMPHSLDGCSNSVCGTRTARLSGPGEARVRSDLNNYRIMSFWSTDCPVVRLDVRYGQTAGYDVGYANAR